MVRAHAAEWKIDPKRVGVLGFSAGGHLAAAVSTHYETRLYPHVDAADDLSCRPDSAVVVYPGYLALADKGQRCSPGLGMEIASRSWKILEFTEWSWREFPTRFAEAKQIDAVLDLVGNSTILDSLRDIASRRACLAGWLGRLAPIADFNPLL